MISACAFAISIRNELVFIYSYGPISQIKNISLNYTGFVMVKRALAEAHKEKHGLKDGELERDGFGGLALRTMLGDVMYDERVIILFDN